MDRKNTEGVRYKVTRKDSEKFLENLIHLMEQKFCGTNEVGGTVKLDEILCSRVAKASNMDTIVEELYNVPVSACRNSFRVLQTTKKALLHKSVPWWTEGLTILRERVNAQ
jgi:hypothetical protein